METPSSTTIVTRSQSALKNINNNIPISRKFEESEKGVSKSMKRNGKQQQQDRSGFIDVVAIDSPIVGLAAGNLKTPSSNVTKQGTKNRGNMTPGSGEALLRGQVKTLLQKVEEEAQISKISLTGLRVHHRHGLVNTPFGLLAPTPANTPQILNLTDQSCDKNCFGSSVSISSSIITEDHFKIPQIAEQEESIESEKSFTITRSLLLDFSDSSSVVSYGDINSREGEESVNKNQQEDYVDAGDEEESVNDLCSVMNNLTIATKWTGKHTRFVYNSDDEIETVEEATVYDGIVRMNGLPTPKGKHIRFTEED